MSIESVVNAACDRVAERLVPAVEREAAAIAEDVRNRISVPVEYVGKSVIRSLPGEPPRREFGDYIDSWTYTAVRDGDVIRGAAGSTLPGRGVWLEHGTSRIKPRPHVAPAAEKARAEAGPNIQQNL